MKTNSYIIRLFSHFPTLYRAYEAFGIKDIRGGTQKLRSKLILTHGIIKFDGFQMKLDPSSYMDLSLYHQFLKFGLYEPDISRYVINTLKKGDVFVDVGANSGYYSLLASNLIGKSGLVYSFEPHPETFERLRENIRLNEVDNVKAHNIAISSYDGKGTLNVSKSSDGLNSLKFIPLAAGKIEIDVRKLDSILSEMTINAIKIDAEGAELDIIQGASELISRSRGLKIVYEMDKEETGQKLLDKLSHLGFNSYVVENGSLTSCITDLKSAPKGTSNLVAVQRD